MKKMGKSAESAGIKTGDHKTPDNTKGISLDLRRCIVVLSDALDIVGQQETQHGKRVGVMAMRCGLQLGLDENSLNELFELGLLHDCGVSSSFVHARLVEEFSWDHVNEHCESGYNLLEGFPPLKKYALPILFHHTPWEELKTKNLPARMLRFANLIFLADRVDSMAAAHLTKDILKAKDEIREKINGMRNTMFNSSLVDAFMKVSASHSFWLSLTPIHLANSIYEMAEHGDKTLLSPSELKGLSKVFSRIVDTKSPFTAQHSQGVGELAAYLGGLFGLSPEVCYKISIAGYLHDIGKLRIPDEILDKPGPLTEDERAIIEQHSFETYQMLRRIPGLEDIAQWAAFHHETPNGLGYPFMTASSDFPLEARIIAVADVFQALAQKRPYRDSLPIEKILKILGEICKKGALDEMLVEIVEQNAEACLRYAMCSESTN